VNIEYPDLYDLRDRIRRMEQAASDTPLLQNAPMEADIRIPPAEAPHLVSSSLVGGSTKVILQFSRPFDANIERFEIWVSRTVSSQSEPYLIASVKDSPARFMLKADATGYAIAYIRTVMKNGLVGALNASPTVTFSTFT
jgi:hypothetical protein